MKKQEIFDEVIMEEPADDADDKTLKKFSKRLSNSIGWTIPMEVGQVFTKTDKNGRIVADGYVDPDTTEMYWDVVLEDGSGMTCHSQEAAEILSRVAQNTFRLKRIEEKLDKLLAKK